MAAPPSDASSSASRVGAGTCVSTPPRGTASADRSLLWREHAPSLLSFARLVLGVAFPLIPARWRSSVVAAAALSDMVDGRLSRRLGVTSRFGRRLDPVADKAVVGAVLLTLYAERRLSAGRAIAIGLRDLTVVGLAAREAAAGGLDRAEAAPTRLGKAATAAQFLYLVGVLRGRPAGTDVAFRLAAVLSGLAAADYVRRSFAPEGRAAGARDDP